MGGRWKRWACAGLVAGAVGCNGTRSQQAPAPPVGLPTSQGRPSLIGRVFGERGFVPEPPKAEPVAAKPLSKPGTPFSPKTEVALADNEVEAAFMEGRSAVERDQFLDDARQKYQRALKAEPKNREALLGMARMYTWTEDKDRAMAAYQAALKAYPKDHDIVHKMASAQIQFADWNGASESYRHALALDPENRTYIKRLGFCQAQMGQYQQAGETLVRVMTEPEALFFLGRVLIDQDRVEDGRNWVQAAAAKDPQFTAAKEFLAQLDAPRQAQPTNPNPVRQAGFNEQRPNER